MAVKTDSARSAGLALAFDDGTRKSHSVAENTAFVTGFFKGISNEASFVQLVTSLWFVYDAMEGAFDEAQDSTVRAMDFRALRRKQSSCCAVSLTRWISKMGPPRIRDPSAGGTRLINVGEI